VVGITDRKRLTHRGGVEERFVSWMDVRRDVKSRMRAVCRARVAGIRARREFLSILLSII
jgi:hypothetical protein